jgi:hypothetical protein
MFTIMLTLAGEKIIFYKTDSGKSPVQEFIDSLSDKQAKKVAWVLRLYSLRSGFRFLYQLFESFQSIKRIYLPCIFYSA